MIARALVVGLAVALLASGLMLAGMLERLELVSLNILFELRGPRTPAAPIVIVAIDEDSFDELDRDWPFPRALHGELVDVAALGSPVGIGFDVLFPEPSSRGPEDDAAFGAAIARAGVVVLAAAVTEVSEILTFPDASGKDVRTEVRRQDFNLPQPEIRAGAAGVGPVNHPLDRDGHIRRGRLRQSIGDTTLDAFDVHLYRLARKAGFPAAPLPPGDELVINYRGGPGTFPWIPYHRLVSGDVPPERLAGAILLVGATTPTLQDVYSTPFAEARTMPGVEIHAHLLDTLLRGDAIRPVPYAASIATAAAAALLAAWLVVWLRPVRGFLTAALVWVAIAAWTLLAFALWNVWFQPAGVTLAFALGYGVMVVDSFVREQRERRRLSQFFSPSVLSEIVRHRDSAALGSRRRTITVLFSDIRGFTTMSERLEPEVVAEMLHEYLTEMTEVVFRHGGTVDKYVGDCIMALYNAPFDDPDHATNAVRTALELQERTLAVSARWASRLGGEIRNGVGIHTGEAVVGTLGSRQRLEYTAIGDTVNLASRLESLTKEYGASIIVSEDTHALLPADIATRQLGEVSVKGKRRPVKIFAVLPADVRRHPRAVLEVAASAVVLGGGEPFPVRTHDISAGGLCLAGAPAEWTPGTKVQVRLEGGLLAEPVTVEGSIAWRHGDAAGIAFAGLDPGLVPTIDDYVARRGGP